MKNEWLASVRATAQQYTGSAEFLYTLAAVIVCGVVIMALSKSLAVVLALLLLATAAAAGWWLSHKEDRRTPVQLSARSSSPHGSVQRPSRASIKADTGTHPVADRASIQADTGTHPVADLAHTTDPKRWHVSIPASNPVYEDLVQSIRTIRNQHRDPRSFMGGYHVVHPPVEACNAFQRTAITNPSNHLRASAQERRTALPVPAAEIQPTTRVLHRYAEASLAARRQEMPSNYQPI